MRDYRHFLFYSARIEPDRLFLDEAETHHAVSVLRLAKGDRFIATDGRGVIYECLFESVTKREITGSIVQSETVARHRCFLHVIVGAPEREAFETLIAGCTALGVARITPVVCRYCQRPWWERNTGETSRRFHGKMISAMKQSLYPYCPQLDQAVPFTQAYTLMSGVRIAADPAGAPFHEVIDRVLCDCPPVFTVIIGPPGGFSPEESASLAASDIMTVRISPARLTTELAAITLCGAILAVTLPRA